MQRKKRVNISLSFAFLIIILFFDFFHFYSKYSLRVFLCKPVFRSKQTVKVVS